MIRDNQADWHQSAHFMVLAISDYNVVVSHNWHAPMHTCIAPNEAQARGDMKYGMWDLLWSLGPGNP